jgi:hypothetical protein
LPPDSFESDVLANLDAGLEIDAHPEDVLDVSLDSGRREPVARDPVAQPATRRGLGVEQRYRVSLQPEEPGSRESGGSGPDDSDRPAGGRVGMEMRLPYRRVGVLDRGALERADGQRLAQVCAEAVLLAGMIAGLPEHSGQ